MNQNFINNNYLTDFPVLGQLNKNGKRVCYLDSSATTQKPVQVLNAVNNYYTFSNANPHRGGYNLSIKATELLEKAREKVRQFISASKPEEIIFTKSATEALNIIAKCYGETFLKSGDEIVVAISEHHSNLVPWQQVVNKIGCKLTYLYTNSECVITDEEIEAKITKQTKLVAIAHVCNTTGVINPIEKVINLAHKMGAVVVVDGTQSVPHMQVNVAQLNADFYVFSGHKMLAPMGIGVLYGKHALLNQMPPLMFGGDMVEYVTESTTTFAPLPQKFEGGTQNVGGAVGLAAAIDYINAIGFNAILQHEHQLLSYLIAQLNTLPFITIVGTQNVLNKIGVVAFNVNGVHSHDVSTVLDAYNVAIRAGNHCAQPFHKFLNVNSTCRASVYLYNTKQDIDSLIEALINVKRRFDHGA